MLPDVFCHPVTKEHVEQTLIPAIKGALLVGQCHECLEGVHRRSVDEYTRVEAIWPTSIRSGRELFLVKELVTVSYHLKNNISVAYIKVKNMHDMYYQGIGIQEDTLGVLGQVPAMQLGEGNPELWPFQ